MHARTHAHAHMHTHARARTHICTHARALVGFGSCASRMVDGSGAVSAVQHYAALGRDVVGGKQVRPVG